MFSYNSDSAKKKSHSQVATYNNKIKGEESTSIANQSAHEIDNGGKHQNLCGSESHIDHDLRYP